MQCPEERNHDHITVPPEPEPVERSRCERQLHVATCPEPRDEVVGQCSDSRQEIRAVQQSDHLTRLDRTSGIGDVADFHGVRVRVRWDHVRSMSDEARFGHEIHRESGHLCHGSDRGLDVLAVPPRIDSDFGKPYEATFPGEAQSTLVRRRHHGLQFRSGRIR